MNSFFITGVQRSGTTLLSVLLSKHPDIFMERRSIAFRLITCFNSLTDILPYNLKVDKSDLQRWLIENDSNGRLANLIQTDKLQDGGNLVDLIQQSIDLKLKQNTKRIWADKSPNLEYFFKDITLLMPQSKMLHIVRDGRAVAQSMSIRSSRNLLLCAQQWVDGNIQALVNQQIAGKERYLIIHFEDLVKNPEKTLKAVCEFLNLTFSAEILNPKEESKANEVNYVKGDFDESKIDSWKKDLSVKQIHKIEKIQGPLLDKFGYTLETTSDVYEHKPLSVLKRVLYKQVDNIRSLFRSKRMGMVDRKLVEIKIPFKNRVYTYFKVLTQELMSVQILKAMFPRVFYRKRHFDKDELQ